MRSKNRSGSRALTNWMALAVVAVVALLIGSALGGRGPDQARAESVTMGVAVTCTSPIGPVNTEIPTSTLDEPDTATAGEQMSISYATSYPDVVTDSFVINSAVQTWSMPPEVTVDDVEFIGGDPRFTKSYEVTEEAVVTTVTGDGTTSGRPETPTVKVTVTVAAEAAGSTISWPVFANFASNADTFVGNVDSVCTPDDPDLVLNTTVVEGSTEPPPSTTVPEPPPTTVPPDEEPPPSTTVPPPPTTVPPPDEEPPPTTTVPEPPPTTVPPDGGPGPVPSLPDIPGMPELPDVGDLSPEQLQELLSQLGLPELSPEQLLGLLGQLPSPPSISVESRTTGTFGSSQFESVLELSLF